MTNAAPNAPASPRHLTETTWDVAVIGAGVAGGLVAGLCASAGWKTLLVEKEAWPRQKVCGCCVNERGLAVLKRSGALAFLSADDRVDLQQMDLVGRRARVRFPLPGGSVISRSALDSAIAAWAQSRGAVFLPGTLARPQASMRSDQVCLALEIRHNAETQSVAISSRFVVGAWGLGGDGVKWDRALTPCVDAQSHMGAGVILPKETACALPLGTLLMVVGEGGYVGVVRLGDGRLDVAAAFDARQVRKAGGLGPLAQRLLERSDPSLASACREAPWKGTPPLTRKAGNIASGRIFLVGDATGYVEPFTGEGMAWALVGAEALAQTLTGVLGRFHSPNPNENRPDASVNLDPVLSLEQVLRKWQALYRERIQKRQGLCRTVSMGLRFPWLTDLGITLLRWFPGAGTRLARWLARTGSEKNEEKEWGRNL